MNNRPGYSFNIALLIVILLAIPAAVFCQNSEENIRTGYLNIKYRVKGLPVYIDGLLAGKTPLVKYELTAGRHLVTIAAKSKSDWHNSRWHQTINIIADETHTIHPVLERAFYITSNPHGASIYDKEKLIGETPMYHIVPDTLSGMLRFEKEGYLTTFAEFGPDLDDSVNIVLRQDHAFNLMEKKMEKKLERLRIGNERKAVVLAGVSIGAGLAAVLLKKRADVYYNDYKRAPEPDVRDASYEKTARYDKYSSTAFGLFQASFALGFYHFLKSKD